MYSVRCQQCHLAPCPASSVCVCVDAAARMPATSDQHPCKLRQAADATPTGGEARTPHVRAPAVQAPRQRHVPRAAWRLGRQVLRRRRTSQPLRVPLPAGRTGAGRGDWISPVQLLAQCACCARGSTHVHTPMPRRLQRRSACKLAWPRASTIKRLIRRACAC